MNNFAFGGFEDEINYLDERISTVEEKVSALESVSIDSDNELAYLLEILLDSSSLDEATKSAILARFYPNQVQNSNQKDV
jgi:RNase H-fold protein (predicted Holliday junction resolvase)